MVSWVALSMHAATYEFLLRLWTEAGPHRSQCTHSLYFIAQVSDSFGKGCWAALALAHASQNSGFDSGSSWILVMWPFVIVYLIAEGAIWPSFWWASLMISLTITMLA